MSGFQPSDQSSGVLCRVPTDLVRGGNRKSDVQIYSTRLLEKPSPSKVESQDTNISKDLRNLSVIIADWQNTTTEQNGSCHKNRKRFVSVQSCCMKSSIRLFVYYELAKRRNSCWFISKRLNQIYSTCVIVHCNYSLIVCNQH